MGAMFLKAGLVSLGLLLASRLLGLVRESAQAAAFGASGLGDVAVLMLTLPDWIAGVLASGALAYVLLPYWARQEPAALAPVQRRVAFGLLACGGLLALALVLGARAAVEWLAPGLSPALLDIAAPALGWSALAVPPALLAALWSTRLQHERDFTGMYTANLVLNGTVIAVLGLATVRGGGSGAIAMLGLGLGAAMLLRLAWLNLRLRHHAPAPNLSPCATPSVLPAAPLWAWAALAAGLPLTLPFVARSLASGEGEGALAVFSYAWKLVELPLVLVVQLAASLAFPMITRAFAGQGNPGLAVGRAFAVAWALAAAAVAGLVMAAPAAAHLLFGWGRMDAAGLLRIGDWARIGAWGLLPQAMTAVALTVLATHGRMMGVAITYAAALALLIAGAGWAGGDGARLMVLLNTAQMLVAVAALAMLGREAWGWLPWRLVGSTLAALAGVALLEHVLRPLAWGSNQLVMIVFGGGVAIVLMVIAWWSVPTLRTALRR